MNILGVIRYLHGFCNREPIIRYLADDDETWLDYGYVVLPRPKNQ